MAKYNDNQSNTKWIIIIALLVVAVGVLAFLKFGSPVFEKWVKGQEQTKTDDNDGDTTNVHEHTYSNVWTFSSTQHWRATTCGHNIKADIELHVYNSNYECTVCGYKHVHTYSTAWTSNSEEHWYAATCGHGYRTSVTAHTFDDNHKCTVCGYQGKHTFSEEWSYGEVNHYHASTCEHDIVKDVAPHTYEDGICTVCGYEEPEEPHVHEYSEEWSSDTKNHYHAATCEHNVIKDTAAHTYEDGACTVCGYEKSEEPHNHTFSDVWSNDSVNHWHTATCEHKMVTDMATHTYKDGVCTVCGYECIHDYDSSNVCKVCGEKHNHTFSDVWSSDSLNHWHTATCGHKIVTDMAAHTYEDGACTVCGREQG